jgi:hypothetical protein
MVDPYPNNPLVASAIRATSTRVLPGRLRLRWALFVSLLGLVVAFWPASARASLVMSLGNMTGPTAGEGTFEVLLTNTDPAGGATFSVAAFSFELSVPVSSAVQFTGANTDTVSAPYLFNGIGQGSIDPSFTLSLDPFPNTGFTGSDSTFPLVDIPIDRGQSFGLGLISYAIIPGAPSGQVQVTFVDFGTSLATAGESPVVFTTDDRGGAITIAGPAVPEPSTLVMAAMSVALVALSRRLCRKSRQRV